MGILARFIKPRVDAAVRSALAVVENENTFLIGTRSGTQGDRDRYTYDRSEVLEQSLTAWRTNPLARRIIELTSQYVVGGGQSVNCEHEPAAAFLRQFWKHRLNRMDTRVIEMRDELSRSEIFLSCSAQIPPACHTSDYYLLRTLKKSKQLQMISNSRSLSNSNLLWKICRPNPAAY